MMSNYKFIVVLFILIKIFICMCWYFFYDGESDCILNLWFGFVGEDI